MSSKPVHSSRMPVTRKPVEVANAASMTQPDAIRRVVHLHAREWRALIVLQCAGDLRAGTHIERQGLDIRPER